MPVSFRCRESITKARAAFLQNSSRLWSRATPHDINQRDSAASTNFPTKDRLSRWGVQLDNLCPLGSKEEETYRHLFFASDYIIPVALHFWQKLGLSTPVSADFFDTIRQMHISFPYTLL